MIRRTLGTLAIAALAACSGNSNADPPDTTTHTAVTEAAASTPACTDLAGMDTQDVLDLYGCTDTTGAGVTLFATFHDCPDGRRLNWNDHGWGYTDSTWQAHTDGQSMPPDADLAACP